MKAAGYRLESYVSSRCSYLAQTPPGDNCFILEDNTVQPFVTIGNDVTLWSGNHIGHDAVIEDHCFITSHVVVSGYVRVGARSFLGVNATLRNSITLGEQTLVGAGAIIMKDTAPKERVPARARQAVSEDERRDRAVTARLAPARPPSARRSRTPRGPRAMRRCRPSSRSTPIAGRCI